MDTNHLADRLQADDQPRLFELRGHAEAISATICAAACAGSEASRIGRPTTNALLVVCTSGRETDPWRYEDEVNAHGLSQLRDLRGRANAPPQSTGLSE